VTQSALAEKYNNEAEDPCFKTIPGPIMELTAQKWLWERLFPDEEDAFPGVRPKPKQSARPAGNTDTAANTSKLNTSTAPAVRGTYKVDTAANTSVSNTTPAPAASGTYNSQFPPLESSKGGSSTFASSARAGHQNTGSQAKMEINKAPVPKPAPIPQPQKAPVPKKPTFDPATQPILPLVGGVPQFAVIATHEIWPLVISHFLGKQGEAIREVQGKLQVRLRYREVYDKQSHGKILVFFAEPFEKKDQKNADVLYRCLAAYKFLKMWDRRCTKSKSLPYLHEYYREWKKTSGDGEEMTKEKWAKYVATSPSLAGLEPPKIPKAVRVANAAASAEQQHAVEYEKVRQKVIEEYEPPSGSDWTEKGPSDNEITSLIQANFKWDLISRTYVRKTITEKDVEAFEADPASIEQPDASIHASTLYVEFGTWG
jgi:hypothetical protein